VAADLAPVAIRIKELTSNTSLENRITNHGWQKGSVSAFVDSLYNCDSPDQKIADLVSDEQGNAILYYLNKRYKLRLTS